jgi:hypothetical protein
VALLNVLGVLEEKNVDVDLYDSFIPSMYCSRWLFLLISSSKCSEVHYDLIVDFISLIEIVIINQ